MPFNDFGQSGTTTQGPADQTKISDIGGDAGRFNLDPTSLASGGAEAQKTGQNASDLVSGLGSALFGHGNDSLLGGIPGLGDAGRLAGEVWSNTGGQVLGAGVKALQAPVLAPLSQGDALFDAMPHDAEWQRVSDAAAADSFGGARLKWQYVNEALDKGQSTAANPDLFPELHRGVAPSLWDLAGQVLGFASVPQRFAERAIAGAGKLTSGNRVEETLSRAAQGATDLSPVEQAVVTNVGNGTWDEGQALDFMASHGSGLSHNQLLEIAGSFATDPTVLAGLGSAGVAKLAKVGADLAEAGGAASKAAGVGRLASTGAGQSLLKAAGPAAYGLQQDYGAAAKVARTLIDPLSAIGGHGASGEATVNLLGDGATREAYDALGRGHGIALHRDLEPLGLSDQVAEDFGGYAAGGARDYMASKWIAQQVRAGLAEDVRGTVPDNAVIDGLLTGATKDDKQGLRNLFQSRASFNITSDADIKDLAERMTRGYGGRTADDWEKAIRGYKPEQRAILDAALFHHDTADFMRAVDEGTASYTGNVPIERLNMVNRDTFTIQSARDLLKQLGEAETAHPETGLLATRRDFLQSVVDSGADTVDPLTGSALAVKDAKRLLGEATKAVGVAPTKAESVAYKIDAIKAMQKVHPDFPLRVVRGQEERSLRRIYAEMDRLVRTEALPSVLGEDELSRMPLSVQRWASEHPNRSVGFRPPDDVLWNLGEDAEGRFVPRLPWTGRASVGSTYRPGFRMDANIAGQPIAQAASKPLDWLEAGSAMLRQHVNWAAIKTNAEQRFVRSVTSTGLSESEARQLFREVGDIAGHSETTARGLSATAMYPAIEKVLSKSRALEVGMTKRSLMTEIVSAFEGDMRYVGLTQKFTGRVKTFAVSRGLSNENFLGQVSERMYPLLRYKYNPLFQMQEAADRWVFNPMRGASLGLGSEKTAEWEHVLNALDETSLAKAADLGDNREFSDAFLVGDKLKVNLGRLSGVLGSITPDVRGAKRDGMISLIANRAGADVRSAFDDAGKGAEWTSMKQAFSEKAGRAMNDNEVALAYLKEMVHSNLDSIDPVTGKMIDFDQHTLDAWAHLPAGVGPGIRPLKMDAMARRLGDYTGVTDLRRAITEKRTSPGEVHAALVQMGLPEEYAKRVETALNFDGRDFWANAGKNFGLDKRTSEAWQTVVRRLADNSDMTPTEYLSQLVEPSILPGKKATIRDLTDRPSGLRAQANANLHDFSDQMEAILGKNAQADLADPEVQKALAGVLRSRIQHAYEGAPKAPPEPWRSHAYAGKTEMVPVADLKKLREFDRGAKVGPGQAPDAVTKLAKDMRANGVKEPLMVVYDHGQKRALLGEGNHRLAAAEAAGMDALPVRVARVGEIDATKGATVRGAAADASGYVPADLRPSDIGMRVAAAPKETLGVTLQRRLEAMGPGVRASGVLPDVARVASERAVVHAALDRMHALSEDAYRIAYFQRSRTVLERSVNHPFFGLYPASYMWGKVAPELIRFIAKEPFGLRTGAMAYALADVRREIATMREYDPSFDKTIDQLGHDKVLWFLGYLLPATPWEVGANAPAWARSIAQQGLQNDARVSAGQKPKGLDFGHAFVDSEESMVNPLRWADQLNATLKGAGNDAFGTPKEQSANGGARTIPFVGPFPGDKQRDARASSVAGGVQGAALEPALADTMTELERVLGS